MRAGLKTDFLLAAVALLFGVSSVVRLATDALDVAYLALTVAFILALAWASLSIRYFTGEFNRLTAQFDAKSVQFAELSVRYDELTAAIRVPTERRPIEKNPTLYNIPLSVDHLADLNAGNVIRVDVPADESHGFTEPTVFVIRCRQRLKAEES